jgi:hypothetical protein
MSLLFIICILFFIASFSFGIFYLIKGIFNKDFYYIKSGLICFGICLVSIAIPFFSVADMIAESFSN